MKTITIMADFGLAYAWIKDESEDVEPIGPNIADALSGFGQEYDVPAAIETRLATWIARFERDALDPAFDWNRFHEQGIALCRQLKRQWGEAYRVVYQKPREDPNFAVSRTREILEPY